MGNRTAYQEPRDLWPGAAVIAGIHEVLIRSRHPACCYLSLPSQQAWKGRAVMTPHVLKEKTKTSLELLPAETTQLLMAGHSKYGMSVNQTS